MVCPLKTQVRKFHKHDERDSSAMADTCEPYLLPGWGCGGLCTSLSVLPQAWIPVGGGKEHDYSS